MKTLSVKPIDDVYAVQDEMGNVLEKCETHSLAVSVASTLAAQFTEMGQECELSAELIVPATRPVELLSAAKTRTSKPQKTTNASRVRERITEAKAANESADVVVAWAVETLGMSPQLARTYVKNNWAKA